MSADRSAAVVGGAGRSGRWPGKAGGRVTAANMTRSAYRLDPLDRGFVGPLTRRQVVVVGRRWRLWMLFGLVAELSSSAASCSASPWWCRFRRLPGSRSSTGCRCGAAGCSAAAGRAAGCARCTWSRAGRCQAVVAAVARWAAHHRPPGRALGGDPRHQRQDDHRPSAGRRRRVHRRCHRPDGLPLSGWGQVFGAVPPRTGWCGSPGPTSPAACRWSAMTNGLARSARRATDLPPTAASSPPRQPLRHDLIVTITMQVAGRCATARARSTRWSGCGPR